MALGVPVRIPSFEGIAEDIGRFPSSIALVLANLVPLFGAIFGGWNAPSVIVLYWAENVIVGLFNVLKMFVCAAYGLKRSAGQDMAERIVRTAQSAFLIPFFVLHYGIFTMVHGIFVAALFGAGIGDWRGMALGFASLFISHAISFSMNFVGKKEYEATSAGKLMVAPYLRIFVMHVTIIFSAFLMFALGIGLAGLVLLVLLKTIVDLYAHLAERARMAGGAAGRKN